ncbi:type 2 isopentenyl-diphosphate Delta-isomerase [Anaerolineae bacterium CFX9]|nr:type 2 isopentenyl-diphosphate Delta-isomerase [Kamptonema cortianum]MDL1902276.1 type 2 isopentenyl-diphosphate Delta-isomerase [Anaerolineae bacterium CFX9]
MTKVVPHTPTNQGDPSIEDRKVDHIRINLEKDVQFPRLTTGLERFRFLHQALPEINLSEIDSRVTLFNKTLSAPILISSMTGGTDVAHRLNLHLAEAAQVNGIALGLGSQRAALKNPDLAYTYQVRHIAPDILLFANVGAVQLNYGYGLAECERVVEMVEADALILHFNVLQEAVQPEGDTDFSGLLNKVEQICRQLSVPVIAKEVGWGFSEQNARDLANAGVAAIDVAGSGGTSWSEVEYHRAPNAFHARVAAAFADWGIPTATAIQYAIRGAPRLPIIASGGLRDGIDIAKSIALGATLGGIAGPFLKAADESVEAVDQLIRELTTQLRIAMLCTGADSIPALQTVELIEAEDQNS